MTSEKDARGPWPVPATDASKCCADDPSILGQDSRDIEDDSPASGSGRTLAFAYLAAGLSVIPIRADGSKAPKTRSWRRYQSERISDRAAESVFSASVGVAIVCGMLSVLEVMDFDAPELFEPWCELVEERCPGLLARLPIVRTPSDGRHVYVRRERPLGSRKLAQRPLEIDGKRRRETLIETRGEGGYVLAPGCPPACHPSGGTYEHVSGPPLVDLPTRPLVTDEEYEVLINAARSFNECVEHCAEPRKPIVQFAGINIASGRAMHRPGDGFNRRARWDEVLTPHGWTVHRQTDKAIHWCRPGKAPSGTSATTGYCQSELSGDLLFVFSSSAHPFEPGRAYSKFSAFALLNHGGDFRSAARDIAGCYGFFGQPAAGREAAHAKIVEALEAAHEQDSAVPLLDVVDVIATLDAREYAALCEQAADATRKFKKRDFGRLVQAVRRKHGQESCATPDHEHKDSDDERATVYLTELGDGPSGITERSRDPRAVYTETTAALREGNVPPTLFARGRLCRTVLDEHGHLRAELVHHDALRNELLRTVRFVRHGREVVEPVAPPQALLQALMGRRQWDVPLLKGIAVVPIVRPDGSIHSDPGYDALSQFIYAPDAALAALELPKKPTQSNAIAAFGQLTEVHCDFGFADEASRANTLALQVTTIVRPAIDGDTPIGAVDAAEPETGKTLLVRACALLATGQEPDRLPFSKEDEIDKQITQALYRCAPMIMIDNIKRRFESATIESAITTSRWTGRVLGKNTEGVDVPQHATWTATGNNIEFGSEMARRCYLIRIRKLAGRAGFRHPKLLAWVREERRRLVSALLTVIRAWYIADCPPPTTPTIGGFEEWSRVVGGILEYGGVSGFLGNHGVFRAERDTERLEWEVFLRALLARLGDRAARSGEIADLLMKDKVLGGLLPGDLVDAADEGRRRLGYAVGRKFRDRVERRVAPDGLRIIDGPRDRHEKAPTWRVVIDG